MKTSTIRFRRWIAGAVLVAALLPHGFANAAAPLRSSVTALPKGSVRSQYEQGQRAYEGAEYGKAGKLWSELLAKVPESPANRTVRASLVIDTMSAYQAAYEASGDVKLLRAGMDAYYGYFKAYRDAHGSTNIPEPVVEARFVMKEALGHAEAGGNGSGNASGSGNADGNANRNANGSASGSGTGSGDASHGAVAGGGKPPADDDHQAGPGTPLIVSGAVLIALGAGASSMIAVGAVEGSRARQDQKLPGYSDAQRMNIDHRGQSMNALLIAGAVVTPLLLISGISLVAVGASKRHKAQLALAPAISPRLTGVVVRGRF